MHNNGSDKNNKVEKQSKGLSTSGSKGFNKDRLRAVRIVQPGVYGLAGLFFAFSLVGCSLSEEIKQIKASEEYEEKQDASRSTDLTGEQIFIRSCNTCHPGGKQGMGPSLLDISKEYTDDEILKAFIRKGKGIMPAQPPNVINDEELDRLIAYIKTLKK